VKRVKKEEGDGEGDGDKASKQKLNVETAKRPPKRFVPPLLPANHSQ